MNAADYRHRVTLTDLEGVTQKLWVAVEPLSVQAVISARQANQPYTHKIRTRFRKGVEAGMTITYSERTFEISHLIDKEEKHIELQLLCVELKATDPQMSQQATISPCTGYGRHAPEYGEPTTVRCRIDRDTMTGYFPVGTAINVDDRVECGGEKYIAIKVDADRGVANVAHMEVKLGEL